MPTTEEVPEILRHIRRPNNTFLSDFWSVRDRDDMLAFVHASLEVKKGKEKVVADAQLDEYPEEPYVDKV